ncbi:MAG: peptidoglycan-binding protein [Roseibium sp.]
MKVSDQGLAFLAAHEGFVSRGYLDPVGVVTIGYGFTMRSRIFSLWWKTKHGQKLAVGDQLTRENANKLLVKLLDEEYTPLVLLKVPNLPQTQLDACVSVVYNLGARTLSWRWAKALQNEQVSKAAALLKNTGTTAAGQCLKGLVKRRAAEACLLESGDYGVVTAAVAPASGSDIVELQRRLKSLGHSPGPLDGVWGKRTKAAVCAFQRANPPLAIDGVPGAATRAALERGTAMRDGTGAVGTITVLTGGGLLIEEVPLPLTGLGIVTVMIVGWGCFQIWRNRGAVHVGLKQILSRV